MTAVASWIADDGTVWLAADTEGSNGWFKNDVITPKVFRCGDVGFAITGSWRFAQLLQHQLKVPDVPEDPRRLEWWVSVKLVEAIRKCLSAGGQRKKSNEEETTDSYALIAVGGRLFVLQSDFSAYEPSDRYSAHGSGRHIAVGALCAMNDYDITPRERVTIAIRAAMKHASGVGGQVRILKVPK